MRQIKFRAWHKVREKMEYEFYIASDNGGVLDKNINDNKIAYTLMQFTGLTDKNGKEIYEGDWLKDDQGILYQVKFGKLPLDKSGDCVCTYEAFYAEARDSSATYKCTEIAEWMTVIGNIYENPKLLK